MDTRIIKNYIYNVMYQLFVMMVPLVLSPYLARTLGADQLGIYNYIFSTATLITTITLLGTYSYGAREVAYFRDDSNKANVIYNEVFSIRCCLGVVSLAVYVCAAYLSKEYLIYFWLYLPWIVATIIDSSWLFIGYEDMKMTAIKNFCIKLFSALLIFLLIKNTDDLGKYCLVMAITTFLANFVLLLQAKKYIHRLCGFRLSHWKKHIQDSLAMFWPQVAVLFYLQVDKIMLKWLAPSIAQVSYYTYAENIVTIPLTLITMLSTVMMPRIANEFQKNNKDNIKNMILKAGSISLAMAVPMMFGIATLAPRLIPWYLGDSFTPTVTAIIILSPIILTNSLSGILGSQYLTATNQMKLLLKAHLSAAVMNVCINAILIPHLGFIGAAIATVISSATAVSIQYYYVNRQIGVKTILVDLCSYLAKSLPMLLILVAIIGKLESRPITTVIQIFLGALVYLFVLIISKDKILIEAQSIIKRLKR